MIYEIDKETIDFVCKKNLTFTQFAMCLLINAKNHAAIIQLSVEVGIIGNNLIPRGNDKFIKEIDDLIDRGFILNCTIHKDKYDLDNFVVTSKFTDGFLLAKEEVCDELWKEYPKHMLINGIEVPSKAVDYEIFCEAYLKAIKGSLALHREVIAKLKKYKSTSSYAQMKITNFVGSRHWENLDGSDKSKIRLH